MWSSFVSAPLRPTRQPTGPARKTAQAGDFERSASMKAHAIVSNVPPESAINARLADSYFHDCYAIAVPHSKRTALGHFLTALANTPRWADFLMVLRNKIVGVFGMKDLGRLGEIDLLKPDSAYIPGDRIGIFTLLSNTPNEALLASAKCCIVLQQMANWRMQNYSNAQPVGQAGRAFTLASKT